MLLECFTFRSVYPAAPNSKENNPTPHIRSHMQLFTYREACSLPRILSAYIEALIDGSWSGCDH